MATKKTAPTASKAEKPGKAPKAETPVKTAKAAPAKASKTPAKTAAKPEPKTVQPPAKPEAKAGKKATAKAEPKPEPKPAAKVDAKPEPRAAAKKAAKPAPAEAVAAPLIPEVVEAPAPKVEARPAPKAKKAAALEVSTEPPSFTAHAATVLAAIGAGQAVELIFLDEVANPPRTFEPRRLIFDVFTRAWFAWGWDRRYNAERHHRLDLLKEINPVEGPGRAAQGPYQDGTPANQIGGWLGGEPIPVKATLMKQWIFAVKQAPAPFPDFHLEDAPDGKATVTFTATDLRAIARWCMQFGDGIQVLEPQRLVDRIKQVGVAWGGKPVAAAPPPAPKPLPPPARPERDHRREEPREHRREEHRREEHRREEHRRDEPRRDEPRREHRDRDREREAPKDEAKGKPGKTEIRVERL
ncbi:MAG: WYL domain-containing protein [Holophagaceae bacterium]